MAENQKRQSPYQKYGKTPHRYSETYNRWKVAAIKGHKAEADRLATEHSEKFGPGAWRRQAKERGISLQTFLGSAS